MLLVLIICFKESQLDLTKSGVLIRLNKPACTELSDLGPAECSAALLELTNSLYLSEHYLPLSNSTHAVKLAAPEEIVLLGNVVLHSGSGSSCPFLILWGGLKVLEQWFYTTLIL